MKRLHVHVTVRDLEASIGFYKTLFGRPPSVESRCGAVAVGLVCLFPPLSSGGAQVTEP